MNSNNAKCEMCVQKGSVTERVAVFLCFECEIFVCEYCRSAHGSHGGMNVWREEEGMGEKSESETMGEKSESRRIAKTLWDDVMNESEIESAQTFKANKVSICDRVEVKHDLDQAYCLISGLCGLENKKWVVCDCNNYCIKVFKLGSHVIQRYVRFKGSRPWSVPWDVTEIHLKQNLTEPNSMSGSSSDISGTERAKPDEQTLIAVTLPGKRQIMFIDLCKKPALTVKVIKTEEPCYCIQFYDEKIYTICREGPGSRQSVYIKSAAGDTLMKIDTGNYDYHFPCLAVLSGRIYLTEGYKSKVQCRNVKGQVISDFRIEGLRPVGISVDQGNTVYVCAQYLNNVFELDSDLTQCNLLLDQTTDFIEEAGPLCYYRNKLFISPGMSPSSEKFVIVVRLC